MENGQDDYWNLRKLIQEFEKLDYELRQNFPEFLEALINIFSKNEKAKDREIYQEAFEKYNQTLEAKRQIKFFLGGKTQIKASHDLARQLKNIRDNKGYCVDDFYAIHAKLDKNASQEIEEDFDWQGELFSEGTVDYIDENYFRRKRQVGAIIHNRPLPPNILYHLEKLKECYSLGLFEATIIYCRALIESSTYKVLKNRDRNLIHIRKEIKLSELLSRIKKYKPNSSIIKGAYEVKDIADDELHETEDVIKIDEDKACDSIKKTFTYIEFIFA